MPVDQKFIAREVGVSQKTISQYMRHPELVAPETRARIQLAFEQFGYHSHAAARTMRSRAFRRVACLVVLHINPNRDPLPYHPRYVTSSYFGALQKLEEAGYAGSLELYAFNQLTGRPLLQPQCLNEICCDAVLGLLETAHVPTPIDDALGQQGLPVVWLNRSPIPEGGRGILIDEQPAATELAQSLCADLPSGDAIAWFGPKIERTHTCHYSVVDRLNAIRTVMKKARRELLLFSSPAGGILEEDALLLLRHPRPRAVICYNEEYMMALAQGAMRTGVRIPQEIEITGFSGSPPRLPLRRYVRLPNYELGQRGAEYLLHTLRKAEEQSTLLQAVRGELVTLPQR